MSATFAHYQGPASLPSDYAIVSRYAAAHPDNEETIDSEDEDERSVSSNNSTERADSRAHSPRRKSFPSAPYLRRPTVMTMPSMHSHRSPSNVSETTPLLPAPDVPRMIESNDGDNAESQTTILRHASSRIQPAITLGSMTASVSGFSIIQGFTSALDTMLPAAWTSSDPQLVGLWSQRMCVVMAATLVPILGIWLNAEGLLLFLKQDPEVARLAAVYLRWISFGLPAYAFNCVSRRYFQSQGLFAVPTRIIFVVAPINALLNYALVWGPEPIRLGYIGAPIASAISFNLVSLASIIYGVAYVPKTAWHPFSRRTFTSLGILVQLGLAGVGQTASEWWAWELVGLAASLLGPAVLATQSVLLVSASTTFQAPFALAVATSVRIGNLLGEEKARRAGIAANTAIVMGVGIAFVWSAMFLIFRKSWALLFNDDPEVVKLVASILPLVALFQVFDGTSAVTSGILRARGKQFTGALLNLSAYYVVGIPFGMWLTFSWNLGLYGLWIGLTVSLVYCSVFSTLIAVRTDWDREVMKVMERVKSGHKAQRPNESHH
ncbi:multi antimicrobial extrusion (MATE) family protein [Pleurotus pulmonarius]